MVTCWWKNLPGIEWNVTACWLEMFVDWSAFEELVTASGSVCVEMFSINEELAVVEQEVCWRPYRVLHDNEPYTPSSVWTWESASVWVAISHAVCVMWVALLAGGWAIWVALLAGGWVIWVAVVAAIWVSDWFVMRPAGWSSVPVPMSWVFGEKGMAPSLPKEDTKVYICDQPKHEIKPMFHNIVCSFADELRKEWTEDHRKIKHWKQDLV